MHKLCPILRLEQQDQAVILGSVFMEMERHSKPGSLTREDQEAQTGRGAWGLLPLWVLGFIQMH